MSKSAQFFIMYAAVSWGLVGIWSRKLTIAGFSYTEMAMARCVLSAICIFAFLLVANREKVRINIRDIWIFIATGGLGIALCYICYFNTAAIVTLSATTILLYTSPYMVMLLSALVFKEKVTLQKIGALIIAFAGCVMTVGLVDNSNLPAAGIISGLSAAFLYSLYTIFGKVALQKNYTSLTITSYSYLMASLLLIPFCDPGNIVAIACENSANLIGLLVFGIFFTLLPTISYLKGLEKLEPSRASIIAFVEPLTAAAAGIVVYNEMLSVIKVIGIALIFLALVILNWKPRSR